MCPCGKKLPLDRCCGPLLDGAPAPTAASLMRSRYTAHVLARVDYLISTHDPATRARLDRASIERWARDSQWLGLQILATTETTVEFRATYRASGATTVHHELSRFRQIDNRWYYTDGVAVR